MKEEKASIQLLEENKTSLQLKEEKESNIQLLKEEKVGIQLSKEEKISSSNQLIKAFDPNLQLHWMKMDMLTKKVVRDLNHFLGSFSFFSAFQIFCCSIF